MQYISTQVVWRIVIIQGGAMHCGKTTVRKNELKGKGGRKKNSMFVADDQVTQG